MIGDRLTTNPAFARGFLLRRDCGCGTAFDFGSWQPVYLWRCEAHKDDQVPTE
ncbi:MAG: hypothetical protein NVS3B26_30450 [Mycobacteriales bacterium]